MNLRCPYCGHDHDLWLLDLFSGAGGAAVGYHRAGFGIVGVDVVSQPRYPFIFVQGDALNPPVDPAVFAAVHASPPCQEFSTVSGRAKKGSPGRYPNLIAPTRELLLRTGRPWVMENVETAPLHRQQSFDHAVSGVRLCGSMFGLDVQRHRLFESSEPLTAGECRHHLQRPRFRSPDSRRRGNLSSVVGVHGHLNYAGERALRERAMGIDWMEPKELNEAIPPAYTFHVGAQIMESLRASQPV